MPPLTTKQADALGLSYIIYNFTCNYSIVDTGLTPLALLRATLSADITLCSTLSVHYRREGGKAADGFRKAA